MQQQPLEPPDAAEQLLQACKDGDEARVSALLAAGGDVDAANATGSSPLCTACFYSRAVVVSLLLAAGANINSADIYNQTPLDYASMKIPLDYPSMESDAEHEVVALLLAFGANLHLVDPFGFTPLHWACISDLTETAVLLVASGADAHRPNNDGDTPLSIAQQHSPATHAALLDMLPSRATALGLLEDVVDATGLNADLADVVLYHRYVFDSRHCGLAEEFRAASRESRRLQQVQQV
jgi:ankyrin repeat protein